MSYQAWFEFRSDPPATNAIVFATEAEAEQYAGDLLFRWFVPTGYEIRESDKSVNYRIADGALERLETPQDLSYLLEGSIEDVPAEPGIGGAL